MSHNTNVVANTFPGGFTTKDSGNSHFTIDQSGAHVTTQVPGLGQGMPISVHTPVGVPGG